MNWIKKELGRTRFENEKGTGKDFLEENVENSKSEIGRNLGCPVSNLFPVHPRLFCIQLSIFWKKTKKKL